MISVQKLYHFGPDGQSLSKEKEMLTNLLSERWFQRTIADAFASMCSKRLAGDPTQEMHMIHGARRFVEELEELAKPSTAARQDWPRLNMDAYEK